MTVKAPWLTHFGFVRTPFSKSLAPSELFTRVPHQEAVARILHCVQESALGVVTGEVGAGKTVAARAARATLDPPATRSSTSPTPPSAPAASISPSSAPSAPALASSRPR